MHISIRVTTANPGETLYVHREIESAHLGKMTIEEFVDAYCAPLIMELHEQSQAPIIDTNSGSSED